MMRRMQPRQLACQGIAFISSFHPFPASLLRAVDLARVKVPDH
jgi:hypothetical protein